VNLPISLSGRAIKMIALWLGVAALMVQGLAPLCAGGMAGGTGGTIASVVICTVHGFQTVSVGEDGKPLSQQPGKSMSDCCSSCHAPGGFALASPIALGAPSRIAYDAGPVAPASVVLTRFYSSYVSRGPPASVSNRLA
jgi:hypothetical protein